MFAGSSEELSGEFAGEGVAGDVEGDVGGGDSVVGVVGVAGDPAHAGGEFGSGGDDDGEDDRTGVHAARELECGGDGVVGSVLKDDEGAGGDGAGVGAKIAEDEEGSGVGHAVEGTAFVVGVEGELVRLARRR